MHDMYSRGCADGLESLSLTKTAGGLVQLGKGLKGIFSRGARGLARGAEAAAEKLEPRPSGLVDVRGNPISSRTSGPPASAPTPPNPEAPPSLLRQAFRHRNKAYIIGNTLSGFGSNEHSDAPPKERMYDAMAGGLTNALVSRVPFLPGEAGALAGLGAVPLARWVRRGP